jgi:hypothetical protein
LAEVTFSGMPAWLLVAYLEELGGTREGEDEVADERWSARLVRSKGGRGSIKIGRVTVTIEGEEAEGTMEALRKKAQRGGG